MAWIGTAFLISQPVSRDLNEIRECSMMISEEEQSRWQEWLVQMCKGEKAQVEP